MAVTRQIPRLGLDRLIAAAVMLAAFAIGSFPGPDSDYWWHLAVGRYMAQARSWPSPDPFSFSASGQTWTVHEWLIELVMYGLYSAFGHGGPRALFAICYAATMTIVFFALRRSGIRASIAALLALLLMLASVAVAGPRPHLVSLLLFVLTWVIVARWRQRLDRTVWALPVLFLVWGNLHAGFLPGLVLPILVLLGDVFERVLWREADVLSARNRRDLFLAIVLSTAALFCNPNGWLVPAYPFTALGRTDVQAIAEWMPTNIRYTSNWPFFGLVGLYLLLVIVRRPHLRAFDLLAAGVFAGGGLWVVRVVPFASIALTLLIASALARPAESLWRWLFTSPGTPDAIPRPRAISRPPSRWLDVVGVLPLVSALVAVLAEYNDEEFGTFQWRPSPAAAIAALGAQGLPTPLLNQYNYGGYLIWTLAPEKKVFIDGRSHDLYTHGSLFTDYVALEQLEGDVDGLLDKYAIQTVLYPKDTLLSRYLLAKGTWRTTYEADGVIVLQRR